MPRPWAEPFTGILIPNANDWKKAKGKAQRKLVIESVAVAIQDQLTKSGDRDIECLHDKISNWFGNNAAKYSELDEDDLYNPPRRLRAFSVRDVVKFTYKGRIREVISEQTDDQPGFGDWISYYPAAVTTVKENLTDDELADAKAKAKEWNEDRPPKEVQQMYAEKSLADEVKSFLKEIEHRTGAQLFVLAAFRNSDDTVATAKFQTPHQRGDHFTSSFPEWKVNTWKSWERYVKDQYDENYEGTDTEQEGKRDPPPLVKYHEEFGWPLIPEMGDMRLEKLKATLRAYVIAIYRRFVDNEKVVPSWVKLSEDFNYEYVDSDSLPGGAVLRDPSKTRIEDLTAIWHHWIARQTAGTQGLVFRKSLAKASAASPPSGPTQPRKGDQGVSFNNSADNREGPSQMPDPDSPAAHATSIPSQMAFLRSLSSEQVYNKFVDLLYSEKEQGNGTFADNLPPWGNWQWNSKFLPAEFHQNNAILQMTNLAREDFHAMGSDAQLVVLSIGLALRDISAVHFHEEGEIYPDDFPEWVKSSPYSLENAARLLDTWGQQLVEEDDSNEKMVSDANIKGKGKAKATGRPGKRKAKPSEEIKDKDPANKKGKMVTRGTAKPSNDNLADGRTLRPKKRHCAK